MKLLKPKSQQIAQAEGNLQTLGLSVLSYRHYIVDELRLPFFLDAENKPINAVHRYLYEKAFYMGVYKSANTARTYAECIKAWFTYLNATGLVWEAVTVRQIVAYRNSMKSGGSVSKKTLSAATINLRINVIIDFYRYWWKELERTQGDTEAKRNNDKSRSRTVRFRVNTDRKGARALSLESCAAIYGRLKGAHKLIFLWCVCTGMRISSVLSVELSQVEALSGGSFLDVTVKGGRKQSVYIPRLIVEETFAYKQVERTLAAKRGDGPEAKLFLNNRGESVSRECYYAAYKRACVVERIKSNPHQTRATFATHLESRLGSLKNTHNLDPLKIIQGLLGHASSETTQIYLENIKGRHIDITSLIETHADVFRSG